MQYTLTDEQRMLQEMIRGFAQDKLKPKAGANDESGRFPEEMVPELGSMGLLAMALPEELGGAEVDTMTYCLAMEEISAADASVAVMMSVQNSLVVSPIHHFGTEEQKQKYLPKLASGELIGCYCLTEPGAGSDAAALKASCRKEGDTWILNGVKQFITNGPHAGLAVVYATEDSSKGHRAINAFLVEKDFPGYSVGKIEHKMGIRSSSTCEILLEDCQVPDANLLGERGKGFTIAMATLDGGRIGIATQALGIARAALEEGEAYAKQREAFGKPISSLQAIQWKLADMAVRVDAARLLIWRAASLADHGHRYSIEAAMAKLFASEAARFCSNEAVQIHGGYGYIKEFTVERLYRDAKITELYEGTSEIQRLVIATNLLKGGYRGALVPEDS